MLNFRFPSISKIIINFGYVLLIDLFVFACQGKRSITDEPKVTDENQVVKIAAGFTIDKVDYYWIVTIRNPWQGAQGVSMIHYLVPKGKKLPYGVDSSEVISIPLERIICMSTTHAGMISALGETNSIKGLSGTGLIYSPEITEKIRDGLIEEVGYESSLNQELIIKISPDLVMMYGIGSESAGYVNKIRELGIKIMFNGDYLETDPIAKAEWIKLFGILYCREDLADSIFMTEVHEYNKLKEYLAEKVKEKPVVLLGLPYKDTWYVSPGNSFISQLINDAGGSYLWKNTSSSTSMPYGLENVFISAVKADYWLNIGTVTTSSEIIAVDNRLGELPSFIKGNLYNNNNRITPSGGNDYWESGTVHPHIILKDLATILHPELFADNNLFYYRKIN